MKANETEILFGKSRDLHVKILNIFVLEKFLLKYDVEKHGSTKLSDWSRL